MTEQEAVPAAGKQLVLILAALILVAAVLTAIDYRLKAQVVAKVNEFRHLYEGGTRDRPQPAPRPRPVTVERTHQPRHHPEWLDGAGVGDGAAAAEDDGPAVAAPVVQPGDESHRPPRRGSFDA